jgi:hypothetical protein
MKHVPRIPALLLATLVAACSSGRQAGTIQSAAGGLIRIMNPGHELALRQGMRELWGEHVVWTRDYIIAATSDNPSAQTALDRLMKNQEDIGRAIAPYYGPSAGSRLTTLLEDHIRIAGEVVAAAKANHTAKLNDADRRWHDNAAEIATFLSEANPHWPRADLQAILDEHLALTTQEATHRLHKMWAEDQATFDKVFDQAMAMADHLAEGILKQFPEGAP